MSGCCLGCSGCAGQCADDYEPAEAMILGTGDEKTREWATNTMTALTELGRDARVEYSAESHLIAIFGVSTLPALVYCGQVIGYGSPLSVGEIKTKISQLG